MTTKITELDIREVSLVSEPVNPAAVIPNVTQYLAEKYGIIPKED